jgi:branched-chain amino acid transport system permease protein
VLLAVNTNTVQSAMGDTLLLKAFAVIIIAGVGSMGGALVAAYLLAFLETAAFVFLGSGVKDAIAFAAIFILLVVRPEGLFSRGAWQRA